MLPSAAEQHEAVTEDWYGAMTSKTPSNSILVIEDDPDIGSLVELHLADAGHRVTVETHGRAGLDRALTGDFDLVILDLMLPGVDGLEICRRLRAEERHIPILMLTARSTEVDRVVGLEIGADDYLTKPFSVRELTARVKALFRRVQAFGAEPPTPAETISAGDLVIDRARREVRAAGEVVNLTAKEFDLLVHFAGHPGQVFTRSQLLDQIWGYAHDGYEHTVNTHINRLRRKIEPDLAKPRYIITVWGVGYRFPGDDEL
jgi:DNA-binding response OmpR family regulator